MFGRRRPEVLVVGAGPVGLLACVALEMREVGAQVVDAAWEAAGHGYAVALHPHTLGLLDDLGLVHPLIDEGLRVDRVTFCDRHEAHLTVDLETISTTFPYVLLVSQGVLETALAERLHKLGRKIEWNQSVSRLTPGTQSVRARIDHLDKAEAGYGVSRGEWVIDKTRERDFSFVMGADGHQSLVRRSLSIPEERVGEPETHAVFEFHGRSEPVHDIRVVISEHGTDVLWPLPGGRWRWSFQLDPAFTADRLSQRHSGRMAEGRHQLPVDMLDELLDERAQWFGGTVGMMEWSTVVRYDQRLTTHFAARRCLLLGDAAHTTGPAAVHSLNAGLQEAHDAASLVAGVVHGHTPESQLDTYDRERISEWHAFLRPDEIFEPRSDAPRWVREHSDALLGCLPATGPSILPLARQMGFVPRPIAAQ